MTCPVHYSLVPNALPGTLETHTILSQQNKEIKSLNDYLLGVTRLPLHSALPCFFYLFFLLTVCSQFQITDMASVLQGRESSLSMGTK